MADVNKDNYFFLNREGRWPGFQWSGLELRSDGALQLSSVPLFSGDLPDAVKAAPVPDGPAGIAIDAYGTLYFSDPDRNQVWRIDGCDGNLAPAPCMAVGQQPGGLQTPRGLLIPSNRQALFVADSGNHRIQIFDLDSFQLVEVWGQYGFGGASQPGSQPGQLNTPWTMASDAKGNVYVVDYGSRRVQKFNAIGEVVASFWQNVQASGFLSQPSDIALMEHDGAITVFVVDSSPARIFLFDGDGHAVLGADGYPLYISDPHLQQPMGIAASSNALYVGDNRARRILSFQLGQKTTFAGEAIGYQGPTAALFLDAHGDLWVSPGGGLPPLRLDPRSGYSAVGYLWREPLQVEGRKVKWHRLEALTETLAEHAHLDVYAYSASDLSQAPNLDTAAADPFADPKWQSVNYVTHVDVADLYLGGDDAKYLWIAASFSGDGTASPVVRQLRVEFDYPTYDQYLPAIYRDEAACSEFLVRLLSLFQSEFEYVEEEIASLPRLFDPQATPKRFLAWLAGCLGFDVDDNWDERQQRRLIAEIFRLSGKRGTAEGLRESLRLFAGVNATIQEPILGASWWALPSVADSCCAAFGSASGSDSTSDSTWRQTQDSVLGMTTMLAPAQPQGAVVGTSAVLDQSQLIAEEEFGSSLFSDVAYQFSVLLYRGQLNCAGVLPKVQVILEQEKPAHTAYHLCVIEPRFRVGFQSRIGIDSVVGGAPCTLSLGSGQALGEDTALKGAAPTLLGVASRLGQTTRLG